MHVYKLITEDTLEERLLDTLAAKQDLALAALDFNSDVQEVLTGTSAEALQRRLALLLRTPAATGRPESSPNSADRPEPSGQLMQGAMELAAALQALVHQNEQGKLELRIPLDDREALQALAQAAVKLKPPGD